MSGGDEKSAICHSHAGRAPPGPCRLHGPDAFTPCRRHPHQPPEDRPAEKLQIRPAWRRLLSHLQDRSGTPTALPIPFGSLACRRILRPACGPCGDGRHGRRPELSPPLNRGRPAERTGRPWLKHRTLAHSALVHSLRARRHRHGGPHAPAPDGCGRDHPIHGPVSDIRQPLPYAGAATIYRAFCAWKSPHIHLCVFFYGTVWRFGPLNGISLPGFPGGREAWSARRRFSGAFRDAFRGADRS